MDFQFIVCDQSCKWASLVKLFTVVLSAAGHYSFRLLRNVHRVLVKRTFERKDTKRFLLRRGRVVRFARRQTKTINGFNSNSL